jgi:cyclopropane fatty-acyl-phospholipid synthase-like methyltransferase
MICRHCQSRVQKVFLDLGTAPPSNAYLSKDDLVKPELYYPLRVMVCDKCWLVQTEDFVSKNELFQSDYAYFSSTSTHWLEHAKTYVDKIVTELDLNANSNVVEIASNDGYLLKNFVEKKIPCFGIEPTGSTAEQSKQYNIPVIQEFFTEQLAKQLKDTSGTVDLIIGNNVYAHVPDINDFTKGMKEILSDNGVITLEFPHLKELIEGGQFDTIYHEHFSYLSLTAVSNIFRQASLRIYKVEKLTTHGGSLRIYGCHLNSNRKSDSSVIRLLREELLGGLANLDTYVKFHSRVQSVKSQFLNFLLEAKASSKKVVGYGAAAKGSTLLNYCGVKSDLISCVFDAAEAKQNKYLPGSRIPILQLNEIENTDFDYMVIFPWNLKEEIFEQFLDIGNKNFKFVTAVPELNFYD